MSVKLTKEKFYGIKMKKFEDCLQTGKLRKFKIPNDQLKLEIKAAEEDLREAKDRLAKKKFKYATIDAYYSLFHSARALLYLKGYREKSHFCLGVAIETLYVKEKILEPKYIEYFEEAMGLREAADYQNIFSKDGAFRAIKGAGKFFEKTRKLSKEALKRT